MTVKKISKPVLDIDKIILSKLSSPNVSFLFGAGSSKCVGYPLMTELSAIAKNEASQAEKDVAEAFSAIQGSTIEDFLEELYGQLRSPGLSRVKEGVLLRSVDLILNVIFNECSKPASLDNHKKFVRAIFERINERKNVNVITTNYDMLFEWACDEERKLCINGFLGVQEKSFDANQFDIRPAQINRKTRRFMIHPCIYLYKLHGSISWLAKDGIKEHQIIPGSKRVPGQLMVFPTPQKYSEVSKSPYVEIVSRVRDILSLKQTTLVTLGFGFRDMHISTIIEQCLKDNTFILVVLSKEMLETFEFLKGYKNVTIVTEKTAVVEGKDYQIRSDLWNFSRFVELFSHS